MELQEHKRLIDYLPEFLQEYREYREICRVEQMEVDVIFHKIDRMLSNMFTETADLEGIMRREKMYGMVPLDTATKEERKLAVKAKEARSLPYTIRHLYEMLTGMCGVGNYRVDLDAGNYGLGIKVRVTAGTPEQDAFALLRAIDLMIKQLKPCNLTYTSALFDYHSGSHMVYNGSAVSMMKTYQVEVV